MEENKVVEMENVNEEVKVKKESKILKGLKFVGDTLKENAGVIIAGVVLVGATNATKHLVDRAFESNDDEVIYVEVETTDVDEVVDTETEE